MRAVEAQVRHALQLMARTGAPLAPEMDGVYAVWRTPDRRRRPAVRLNARAVQDLAARGAISGPDEAGAFMITAAGAARVAREGVANPYLAQHALITERAVIEADGAITVATSVDAAAAIHRLAALKDAAGQPFVTAQELAAARRLNRDWRDGRRGELACARWGLDAGAGGGVRAQNRAEDAVLRGMEARRRVDQALAALASPLRGIAKAACLDGHGVAAIERRCGWPARSGKVALKLALAQLAQAYEQL